jgi:hypothetical protein
MTVAGSSLLVRCILLFGVLFLVVIFVCFMLAGVLGCYDLRVEEKLSVSAEDQKVKTRS